ncbi:hypothetical protein AC579_4022 [Pseudocercospora musae]|uniref:Uncharacterized protein n=1 Tax=Pseudocercospora musae TaxID=113226 RepID=A0A139I2R2_9PEZI|nr:hypothetical protein AC579_4022 [Pseudocercospora musae]
MYSSRREQSSRTTCLSETLSSSRTHQDSTFSSPQGSSRLLASRRHRIVPRKRFTHRKAAEEEPVPAQYKAGDCQAELVVDWGTYSCLECVCDPRPRGPRPAINILWMDGMNQEIRSMATWDGDEFLHGTQLQERLDEDPSLGDKVIDLFKLALYEDEGTLAIRQRTSAILRELGGNKTFDLLLYEHIRAIINDSKNAILEESIERLSFSKEDF